LTGLPPVRCVVVTAVNGDDAAAFAYPAAVEVAKLLQADGRYRVTRYLPYERTRHDIYVDILTHKSDPPGHAYVFGYFSVHGSKTETGLVDAANQGQLFVDQTTTNLFTDAILVLTACLRSGQFPAAVTRRPNSVRAVIGYRSKLVIGTQTELRKWLGGHYDEYHHLVSGALAEPVRSLLRGESAGAARDAARGHWQTVCQRARVWGVAKELEAIIESNEDRLDVWGDERAVLPLP
jgi:hypothetical protein